MSIAKVTEIIAESKDSFDDAVRQGIKRATKTLVAGVDVPRKLQPRRVSTRDWYRVDDPDHWPALWPAEPAFGSGSPFRAVALSYPHRDLGWLPDGELGILVTFVLASMAVGFLALKPLGVQI